MPAIAPRRPSPRLAPPPSPVRRIAALAVAGGLAVAAAVWFDPLGLRRASLSPPLLAGAIALETVLGLLLLRPIVDIVFDLAEAWVNSEPPDDGRRRRDWSDGGWSFGDGCDGGDGGDGGSCD